MSKNTLWWRHTELDSQQIESVRNALFDNTRQVCCNTLSRFEVTDFYLDNYLNPPHVYFQG